MQNKWTQLIPRYEDSLDISKNVNFPNVTQSTHLHLKKKGTNCGIHETHVWNTKVRCTILNTYQEKNMCIDTAALHCYQDNSRGKRWIHSSHMQLPQQSRTHAMNKQYGHAKLYFKNLI